jgi:uncharacterized protein YxjI
MKRVLLLLVAILIIVSLSACGGIETENAIIKTETCRIYKCDYKSLNINTKITTTLDGEEISISGNIFRLLTDPLTVKDSKGNVLGYAGDVYGFISQDDHGIYIGEEFDVNMCGNVDLFGESYELKDSDGNIVGTVEFNMSNTGGSIRDAKGNLIAKYSSPLFMNDYTVTIYDNNICSDMSILMIVASYVSDYMAG